MTRCTIEGEGGINVRQVLQGALYSEDSVPAGMGQRCQKLDDRRGTANKVQQSIIM
jgi:hypothetical protein